MSLAHVGKHQSAEPLHRAVRENGLSVSGSSSSVATDEMAPHADIKAFIWSGFKGEI